MVLIFAVVVLRSPGVGAAAGECRLRPGAPAYYQRVCDQTTTKLACEEELGGACEWEHPEHRVANGMEIIEGGQEDSGQYWVYIAYNPDRLEPQGERVDQQIHKDRETPDGTKVFGTGWGMAQRFRDKLTGLTVDVVNVHTGHNYSEDSMRQAKADIETLQNSLGDCGDVTITGGDFNELGGGYKKLDVPGALDIGTIGEGCTDQKTHSMGATDKIGASGPKVLSAESEVVEPWNGDGKYRGTCGSDHNAVKLTVKLNV
jgi:hypothetical protein